jgi:ribonuclease P protein component
MAPAATPAARFGISIGRRAAKKAVVRNRVKRLAREAFRRHIVKQSPVDLVLTFTSRFDASQPGALLVELADLLDRARARLAA